MTQNVMERFTLQDKLRSTSEKFGHTYSFDRFSLLYIFYSILHCWTILKTSQLLTHMESSSNQKNKVLN